MECHLDQNHLVDIFDSLHGGPTGKEYQVVSKSNQLLGSSLVVCARNLKNLNMIQNSMSQLKCSHEYSLLRSTLGMTIGQTIPSHR